ncbi:MAG: hypothetical protein HY000_00890 [Planctomycetes bacterium]|nr:hypothetical protein [Planctomycetota bacterium]
MSTAPATVIRRYGRALTADQRPLISIADDQMLEEAVYHLFKIPARGPVTVEWVGKVVTRSAGQVGVRLTLWDGKGWKDVGQDNTYIRGPLQVQANPASGDRELYLLVNCTSSTGTVATDYIGVIQPDTGK